MRLDVRRLNRILSNVFEDIRYLTDEDRELPMKWSVMHMYSSAQLATLVAIKRGLNPEILGICATLHDIGAIKTKQRENHAKNGSPYVLDILETYNKEWRKNLNPITEEEQHIIHEAVINHSDKEIVSNNPYVEAMKDIDSLDRYLHGVPTKGAHVQHLNNMITLFDLPIQE